MSDLRDSAESDYNFRLAALVLLERIAVALETRPVQQRDIEHTLEGDPDYLAAMAAEVESRIQGKSTPNVGRCVDVQEPDEELDDEGIRVNLLEQPRIPLEQLKEMIIGEDDHITAAEAAGPVAVAALEIVYSNLPPDQWGSDLAAKQISKLVEMHQVAVTHE